MRITDSEGILRSNSAKEALGRMLTKHSLDKKPGDLFYSADCRDIVQVAPNMS